VKLKLYFLNIQDEISSFLHQLISQDIMENFFSIYKHGPR